MASRVTNQATVNLRILKSYQASCLTTMLMRLEMNYRGKKRKTHKHMEAKQYITQ